jgi:hypothetical protein
MAIVAPPVSMRIRVSTYGRSAAATEVDPMSRPYSRASLVGIRTHLEGVAVNLVYTVLIAFPLGILIRSRGVAVLTYLVLGSWVFAFQTTTLVLSWLGHSGRPAFGPFPTAFPAISDMAEVLGYAAVNVIISAAGVGLVMLGHRTRARRSPRQAVVALP